jgi:hypothetical protein
VSLAAQLKTILSPVFDGRVSPDRTPDKPVFPLATYQAVGGQSRLYADRSFPTSRHARVQLHVWSLSRLEADDFARQATVSLVAADWPCEPYGEPVALYNDVLDLYGCRQDFGIWYTG